MVQAIEWHTANALWDAALQDQQTTRFRQPAILRFAGDDFMADLERLLAGSPDRLPDLVLRPESWRRPQAGWLAEDDPLRSTPARLYQPAHGRFYLVAASLVCRQPGLPDKVVDSAAGEAVAFVLRRLEPVNENEPVLPANPASYREYGWYLKPTGSRWVEITTGHRVEREEERLPMFAMTYVLKNRKRRLRAGFLPVASRETYQAGALLNPLDIPADELAGDPLSDQRQSEFDTRIRDTLTDLLVEVQKDAADGPPILATAREVLLFSLVDLAVFLQAHLAEVWAHIDEQRETWQGSDAQQEAIFAHLRAADFREQSWATAIRAAWELKGALLATGAATPDDAVLPTDGMSMSAIVSAIENLAPAELRELVVAFIAAPPPTTSPPPAAPDGAMPPQVPKLDPAAGALYAVRCVYERPQCRGARTSFVSELSVPFQLASFFDPDAPGRPIRIAMPVDTSPEGLRKFPRNVSFLISNQLRNQMERIEGITLSQLEEGEVKEEGNWTLGMICSLSIPIITICALILLLVIVFVLNIVFWWLPFFKICFPLILPSRE